MTSAPLRRREGWPKTLAAFIESRRRTPFAWGWNDCCLFAADAVRAMCGRDPARTWRGYKTGRGASNRLRRHGGVAGLMEHAAARQGWAEVAPAYAQRGDVVLYAAPRGDTLAVVDMSGRLIVTPGADGLISRPLAQASRAWRID